MKIKTKKEKQYLVGIILIAIGTIIGIEQYFRCGSFFQLEDIHHEIFIVAFLMSGLTIILLNRFLKNKKKKKSRR